MGLETATYIDGLVATNPTSTDLVKFGDDHLRLIKAALLATFPNVTGAVTPTHTELNYVEGVTSAIQTQLDAKQELDDQLTDVAGLEVTDGNIIVGDGTNFVAESGADARTSLGVGTGDSPQFTSVEIGHESDSPLARQAAGQLSIDGDAMFSHEAGVGTYPSAKIHVSTSAPVAEGSDGDIWLEREA